MIINKSHGEIIRVCMGKFTTAFRNTKIQTNSQWKYLTLLPQCIACYLTTYYDERTHFSALSISRFTTYIREAFLMYVVNLEMFNSLTWVLFNCIFTPLKAVVNFSIQTLIILPWPLFREMIIAQLKLGLHSLMFVHKVRGTTRSENARHILVWV